MRPGTGQTTVTSRTLAIRGKQHLKRLFFSLKFEKKATTKRAPNPFLFGPDFAPQSPFTWEYSVVCWCVWVCFATISWPSQDGSMHSSQVREHFATGSVQLEHSVWKRTTYFAIGKQVSENKIIQQSETHEVVFKLQVNKMPATTLYHNGTIIAWFLHTKLISSQLISIPFCRHVWRNRCIVCCSGVCCFGSFVVFTLASRTFYSPLFLPSFLFLFRPPPLFSVDYIQSSRVLCCVSVMYARRRVFFRGGKLSGFLRGWTSQHYATLDLAPWGIQSELFWMASCHWSPTFLKKNKGKGNDEEIGHLYFLKKKMLCSA